MMSSRALGVTVHTGWAACVVVAGTLEAPQVVANARVDILGDAERFCFHRAAEMRRDAAAAWLAELKRKAVASAKPALAALVADGVRVCAIVGSERNAGDLGTVLASHARIHLAEGCFYRDVVREACEVPVHLVAPARLDAAKVGKLAPPPWGRDQKLAALAAFIAKGGEA
jgi:hypothetical protein